MPSQVARTPEEQCLAFAKDHRRCRLEKEEGQQTCPYHKEYFSRWFDTRKGFHRAVSSKREIEEYHFQICKKHVTVPESHIASLDVNYSEYYTWLLEHTDYPATVNRRCLKYCVDTLSWSIFIAKRLDSTKRLFNSLAYLFTDVETIQICFELFWEEMVDTFRFYKGSEQFYTQRFRQVFYSPVWRPILFQKDLWYCIQIIWEKNLEREAQQLANMNPHLHFKEEWSRERFQDLLYEMTVFHQTKIKERIQPFKEELIAAAWHPRRVERWIEKYGLDILDTL